MKRLVFAGAVAAFAAACTLTPEGARIGAPPAPVQGGNDAQGSPPSIPGAGMGAGSGKHEPGGSR